MKLFFRLSGQGRPLIILHGLFGSSDNWYTLSKTFSKHYAVYVVDQRNHGQSQHADEMNYAALTEDLHDFVTEHQLTRPMIIGHSMGGKTTMNYAVKYPDEIDRFVIVDIVPKVYPMHHDHILEGLHDIPFGHLSSRTEADAILSRNVPEPEVRQFLLKNLGRRPDGGFEWKINLEAIDRHIGELGEGMIYSGKQAGSCLFIRGKKSNYYGPGDEDRIRAVFPNAEIVTMDTGHWVQAERPEEFAQIVLTYLAR